MPFTIKTTSSGDFEQPTPGPQPAVCSRVIDWGTQDWGQFGPKRRVQIVWELDQRRTDGGVMSCSKMYTLSLNEKANLRKDLESWRGKGYGDNEIIDLESIVGQPAFLNLVEDHQKGRVNVAGVMPLPPNAEKFQPTEKIVFNFDAPDWDAFNSLHESTQVKLMETPEYKDAMSSNERDQNAAQYAAQTAGARGQVRQQPSGVRHYGQAERVPGSDDEPLEDDIPF